MPTTQRTVTRGRSPRWVLLLVSLGAFFVVGVAGVYGLKLFNRSPRLLCTEFDFQVTDAKTGEPIKGASIQRFIGPQGERFEMTTGADGKAGIASFCLLDDGWVRYPGSTFTVFAPGYQSVGPVRMTTYTGERGKASYKLIEIRLERDPNAKPN